MNKGNSAGPQLLYSENVLGVSNWSPTGWEECGSGLERQCHSGEALHAKERAWVLQAPRRSWRKEAPPWMCLRMMSLKEDHSPLSKPKDHWLL